MNVENANTIAIDLYAAYRKSTGTKTTVVLNKDLIPAIEALRRVPELVKVLREAQDTLKALTNPEFNSPNVRMDIDARIEAVLKEVQS